VIGENPCFLTSSERQTISLGRKLGRLLKGGDAVGLAGVLGSGKTWLTKGIALGMDVDPGAVITSPSFILVNEYEGRHMLYHMDVYRLASVSEFYSAGLEEYFHLGGVVVMEWADRWPGVLPEHALLVRLSLIDAYRRQISMSGSHTRALDIMNGLYRKTE
jgi:tRNA threonylcarbamoyladenosine biosynthesis protein TsaE